VSLAYVVECGAGITEIVPISVTHMVVYLKKVLFILIYLFVLALKGLNVDHCKGQFVNKLCGYY